MPQHPLSHPCSLISKVRVDTDSGSRHTQSDNISEIPDEVVGHLQDGFSASDMHVLLPAYIHYGDLYTMFEDYKALLTVYLV